MANQILGIELFTAQGNTIIQAEQFETGRVDTIKLTAHGQVFPLTKRQAKLLATDREGMSYEILIQEDPEQAGRYLLVYPEKFFNNSGLFIQARLVITEGRQLLHAITLTIFVQVAAPDSYALPIASEETLGGVKVGEGLSIDEEGKLDVIDSIIPAIEYEPGMENVWISGTLKEIRTALANGETVTNNDLIIRAQEVTFSSGDFKSSLGQKANNVSTTPISIYLERTNEDDPTVRVTRIVRDSSLHIAQSGYAVDQFSTLEYFQVSNASSYGMMFFSNLAITALNTLLIPTKATSLPTPSETQRKKLFILQDNTVHVLNYAGDGFIQIG